MIRTFGNTLLTACMLAISATTAMGQQTEEIKLETWFKGYIEQVMVDEPMTATRLGDHRFDDRLEDLSPDARLMRLNRDKKALADLPQAVNYKSLKRASQVDYEILSRYL